MSPLVSIITPTYKQSNMENFHRMVQSVATQTYKNWEHIICSDGIHEENIKHIVTAYKDPRRVYMTAKQHYGGYGAYVRQEVMTDRANGKYFVFLDDDNFIFPDYISKMVKSLEDARDDERFCICKILHFGPVRADVGNPPLYLRGEPKLCFIDTLQIMVEAEAMRDIGWVNNHYCADGYTFEELGKRYKYTRIEDCLAVHI